ARKFRKTLALPCDVDPDTAKAEYNNGILEVTFVTSGSKPNGKKISIE
ncbi:MAG: Hsp20 family protein, partial [Candidatus Methanomethylophilaceae archaeon]